MSLVMQDVDILLRLFLALVFGGAIGFERRWRGHAAGPHTNALVACGAALFVVAGLELGGAADTRVLAQVATGIGFLAGGVILRDGLRVRGLNTAATVWCVAAIGCLAGLGHLTLAAVATVLIIFGNSFSIGSNTALSACVRCRKTLNCVTENGRGIEALAGLRIIRRSRN